jgi:HK97 gp10 family phage protein
MKKRNEPNVKWVIPKHEQRKLNRAALLWSAEKRTRVKKVNRKYADLIFKEAIDRCPVDTGNLRSTIEEIVEAAGMRILIGTRKTTYALYVALGTKNMDGQSFLRPAFEMYAADWLREVKRAIRK